MHAYIHGWIRKGMNMYITKIRGRGEKRLGPALFVAVEEVLGLGVLEGATSNDIDPYEDHHSHYEYDVGLPPLLPHVP